MSHPQTTAAALLASLRAAGFTVTGAGGRLLVSPGSRLTAAQREALSSRRDAVLAELAADEAEAPLLRQMADHALSRAGEGGPAVELHECFLWPEG